MRASRLNIVSSHTPEAISNRLAAGPGASYLKDMIYGAIDGAVTSFAVVMGVAGAGFSSSVLIILGLANLFADGFSMAASNYLGTRAQNQQLEQLRLSEQQEIKAYPEGEREEVRQIFSAKGFSGELLERVVEVITASPQLWVDTMLREEYGLSLQPQRPLLSGAATFLAFLVAGSLPLLPFVINWFVADFFSRPFIISTLLTLLAFILVGVCKGLSVGLSGWLSALETVLVGGAAALIAFGVGALLKVFV